MSVDIKFDSLESFIFSYSSPPPPLSCSRLEVLAWVQSQAEPFLFLSPVFSFCSFSYSFILIFFPSFFYFFLFFALFFPFLLLFFSLFPSFILFSWFLPPLLLLSLSSCFFPSRPSIIFFFLFFLLISPLCQAACCKI